MRRYWTASHTLSHTFIYLMEKKKSFMSSNKDREWKLRQFFGKINEILYLKTFP